MRTAAALAAVFCLSVAWAPAASAHPLGNFSINSYSGLRVQPEAVVVDLVVDSAEIPTLQAFPSATSGVPEAAAVAYRERQCAALAEQAQLSVDGRSVPLQVQEQRLEFPPGAAGLRTMRLSCTLRAGRVQTVGHRVSYRDDAAPGRTGWREITAVGDGVRLQGSTVPERSPSKLLTAYPQDLLSSPLDQRSADLAVAEGSGVVSGQDRPAPGAPADALTRGVDRLTLAYTGLVSREQLTIGFGLLAVLLALGLGSLHAFAPGHGKSLMAASLVGRGGSLRQAALIGLSVTATHTLGVLALGTVLALTSLAAPERLYPWLGLVSGLLLLAIGVSLFRSAMHQRGHDSSSAGYGHSHAGPGHSHAGYGHSHAGHGHSHDHSDAGHGHHHGHGHCHAGGHASHPLDREYATPVTSAPSAVVVTADAGTDSQHGHDHSGPGHGHGGHMHPAPARSRTRSLLAVGFAGGLVPSPSALLVLLGGIALGRAWFGVLLVLAYGIGMAAALVGTGLLLARCRDRLETWSAARQGDQDDGRSRPGSRGLLAISRLLPAGTAVVVILVGAAVAVRGAAGI